MTIPDRANPSEPVDCRLAIRILHKALKDSLSDDPAPWLKIPQWEIDEADRDDPEGFVLGLKLRERSKLVMSRALLNGDLCANVTRGTEVRAVPGWAWKIPYLVSFAWEQGLLPFDPRLCGDWPDWRNHRPLLDGDAFNDWLDSGQPQSLGNLPALPAPYDLAQEPLHCSRPPTEIPFVPLTEALTWIAFDCAIDREQLFLVLEGRLFGEECTVLAALETATARITAQACDGSIEMRGKYVKGGALDTEAASTVPIASHRFHDFARFDSMSDGLRFGVGLTWGSNVFSRIFPAGRDDAYHAVTVNRSQLLRHFTKPAHNGRKAPKVPANRQLDHEEIRNRAQAMLAEQPDLSLGSAAASIVASLPTNPRTGRPRDYRHIERLISDLW